MGAMYGCRTSGHVVISGNARDAHTEDKWPGSSCLGEALVSSVHVMCSREGTSCVVVAVDDICEVEEVDSFCGKETGSDDTEAIG